MLYALEMIVWCRYLSCWSICFYFPLSDIDECTEGVQADKSHVACNSENAHCLNKIGGFACSCLEGYQYIGPSELTTPCPGRCLRILSWWLCCGCWHFAAALGVYLPYWCVKSFFRLLSSYWWMFGNHSCVWFKIHSVCELTWLLPLWLSLGIQTRRGWS